MRPPSVDALARSIADVGLPHPLLVDAARAAIAAGNPDEARTHAEAIRAALLQPVINATGVLLHTNLGRAPRGGRRAAGAGVWRRGCVGREQRRSCGAPRARRARPWAGRRSVTR